MKKLKILFYLIFGLQSLNTMAQFELHLGYSQPIKDWAAADISQDAGYGQGGLVLQFGGPISDGDAVRLIANMALGYNAMSSEKFGKEYANYRWRLDPAGLGDSIVSVQTGTYVFATAHAGLEFKIPLGGDSYIPLRATAGPHLFAPPNKSTVKTANDNLDGTFTTESSESIATWSYDIVGLSYQLGTGMVLGERLSLRVDYFGTFYTIGGAQIPNNSGGLSLLYPSSFQSLFFSVGILF